MDQKENGINLQNQQEDWGRAFWDFIFIHFWSFIISMFKEVQKAAYDHMFFIYLPLSLRNICAYWLHSVWLCILLWDWSYLCKKGDEKIIETEKVIASSVWFFLQNGKTVCFDGNIQENEYSKKLDQLILEADIGDSIRCNSRWRWNLDQQSLLYNTKQNILTRTA